MKPQLVALLGYICLALPLASLAQPASDFQYVTNAGAITVTGYIGTGGEVFIPDTINGIAVTSVGYRAFSGNTNVTSVIIPSSVITLSDYAFSSCSGLSNISIGKGVNSIRQRALYHCSSLKSITVDELNPTFCSVAGVLFNKTRSLLIQYPTGIAGGYSVPNTVTFIGGEAFSWCIGLTNITIPSSVVIIDPAAFRFCSSLTSVSIPNSVTRIQGSVFDSCSNLTSVTLGDSVTNISTHLFHSCPRLATISIPASIKSISYGGVSGCTSLTGVYFRGNAPGVDRDIFYGANSVTVYYLPGTTGWGATFGDRPTMLWNPQAAARNASFGVGTNGFGFTITGSSNLVIVIEACTNLTNPVWFPVSTNTLTGGSSYFSDPEWTNYPARLYRLRSP